MKDYRQLRVATRNEKRSRTVGALGLALAFASWAYASLVPDPSLGFAIILIVLSGLCFVWAVWEYLKFSWLTFAFILMIAFATFQAVNRARTVYAHGSGKGFMQLKTVAFHNKQFAAGEQISANISIENEGAGPAMSSLPSPLKSATTIGPKE